MDGFVESRDDDDPVFEYIMNANLDDSRSDCGERLPVRWHSRFLNALDLVTDRGSRGPMDWKVRTPVVDIPGNMSMVELQGMATFTVRKDSLSAAAELKTLVIRKGGAVVVTGSGDVVVNARQDTTDVELLRRTEALRARGIAEVADFTMVLPPDPSMVSMGQVLLNEGHRARSVRGQKAAMLPAQPADPKSKTGSPRP